MGPAAGLLGHWGPPPAADRIERALAAGFSGFIGKPIDIGMFYEQIDAFLGEE